MIIAFNKSIKKINEVGASHLLVPLLIVVGIAIYGSYQLIFSRAAVLNYPIAYLKTSSPSATTSTFAVKTFNLTNNTNKTYASTSSLQADLIEPTYSPDHKYLAWLAHSQSTNRYVIHILTVATGAKKTVALPQYHSVSQNIKWFPNSTKLAVVTTKENISAIRTVNADGTGLGIFYSLPSGGINSFAPSGDMKSIVYTTEYATSNGVYSVVKGFKPILLKAGDCENVRTVANGVSVAYVCTAYTMSGETTTSGTSTIYQSKPGEANATTLYEYNSTYGTGGTSHSVIDIASSPDGIKLAIQKNKIDVIAECSFKEQLQIQILPIAPISTVTEAYNSPVTDSTVGVCKGGIPADTFYIQWSADGTRLAYLNAIRENGYGGALNLLDLTTGTTKQLVAAPVKSISW